MTEVIVHGIPGSPYVRSVLLGLKEKGAPHRLAAMGMGDGRSPEHLARHPFGRIPVIDHGDFQLYETQAILRYVDEIFPGAPLLPADPRAAARANQICGIVDWYLFPQVSGTIGFQRIIVPMMGGKTDEAAVAAAIPNAERCFAVLEKLLAGKPFMAGDQVSMADLMVAPHLDFMAMTPEGASLLAGGELLAWLQRMAVRPSMKATTPQMLGMAA